MNPIVINGTVLCDNITGIPRYVYETVVRLDKLIEENTGVSVRIAENPRDCVGIGTGKCFDMLDDLKEGFTRASTYIH